MEDCSGGIVSKSKHTSQIQDQDGFHPTVRKSLAEFTPYDVANTRGKSALTKEKFLNTAPKLSTKRKIFSVLWIGFLT